MNIELSVTIVIPAFNREGRVAGAIRSALDQTVPALEIIVVNDGSTDGTEKVALSFGRSVRVITIENNGTGPARPRNIGIEAARGSHIMFLDSDDCLERHVIERHRAAILNAPDAGLICSNYFVKRESASHGDARVVNENRAFHRIGNRVPIAPDAFVVPSAEAYRHYCRGNFIRFAATIPRQVCKAVGGFSEALTPAEDMAFFFRVLAGRDLVYIDEPLHTYVHHTENISGACITEEFRDHVLVRHIQALEEELKWCHDIECRAAIEARIVEGIADLAYGYRTNGQPLRATQQYLRYLKRGGSRRNAIRGLVATILHPVRRFATSAVMPR